MSTSEEKHKGGGAGEGDLLREIYKIMFEVVLKQRRNEAWSSHMSCREDQKIPWSAFFMLGLKQKLGDQ